MNPGRLRHNILIQKPLRTIDAYAVNRTDNWETVCALRADIQSAAGTEAISAGRVTYTITHIVTIRHDCRVTNSQRVVWGDRIFQIVEIKEDRTFARVMSLKCAEVLGGE